MYYPNRAQWAVIWLTVLPALAFWVDAADYFGSHQGERLAVSLLVIGGLLFWQFAKRPQD